ncbi:hypothetical protein CPB85DRAFT_1471724, partial [Mucidula mucida]
MSFSDDSDLTELTTSDEEDIPLAKVTAGRAKKKKIPLPALRPPRTVQYSVDSLYKKVYQNLLDLDPEYQRDPVWQDSRQVQLIDSLMNNYYIPPLIFAVSVHDDGEEKRTCIDGKQRLISIQRCVFHSPCRSHCLIAAQKYWYKTSSNNRGPGLPPHLKTRFDNKQLTCVEYDDLTEDQEREIFRRVQLGVQLTPAERLQALSGPLPTYIRELQGRLETDLDLNRDTARGRDYLSIAQVMYIIQASPKVPAQPGAEKMEVWLKGPLSPALKRDMDGAVDTFLELMRDEKLNAPLRGIKVAPVEFVMITYLVFLCRSQMSFRQLSNAIKELRTSVREAYEDIRFNTKVYKSMVATIQD